MSTYSFSDAAIADLEAICDYIAQQNPESAIKLFEAIRQKCKTVAQFPKMGKEYERLAPSLRGFIYFYQPEQIKRESISDAGWSQFRKWIEYFGWKFGKITIAVPPQYTSQDCPACGVRIKKSLSTRTHVCQCGYIEDRDIAASINILKKGLSTVGHTGSYARLRPCYAAGERLPLVQLEQSCWVTETR